MNTVPLFNSFADLAPTLKESLVIRMAIHHDMSLLQNYCSKSNDDDLMKDVSYALCDIIKHINDYERENKENIPTDLENN